MRKDSFVVKNFAQQQLHGISLWSYRFALWCVRFSLQSKLPRASSNRLIYEYHPPTEGLRKIRLPGGGANTKRNRTSRKTLAREIFVRLDSIYHLWEREREREREREIERARDTDRLSQPYPTTYRWKCVQFLNEHRNASFVAWRACNRFKHSAYFANILLDDELLKNRSL